MKNRIILSLLALSSFSCSQAIWSDEKPAEKPKAHAKSAAFEPFTGKVARNKVRLRVQPSVDASVVREFSRDDLIIVLGESDDFYAVQPAKDTKGYVFRTYVLDNVVEGNHVNVRLKPDLDAAIIGQLNSGDRIEGKVDAANPKWLEISAPSTTRFYVAKEFVEKVGDAGLLSRLEKRREDAERFVNSTYSLSEAELQKPFNQIKTESIISNYVKAAREYADMPDIANRANTLLAAFQETYKNKKIAYLESQTAASAQALESKNKHLQDKVVHLEQQLQKNPEALPVNQMPTTMSSWVPVEQALFAAWSRQNNVEDMEAFYKEQKDSAFTIKGVIEPYNRPVKNRPGDYMLVNTHSKLPVAFLYSTKINLQNFMGHEVAIMVAPRANNNYAFPAYFVLSLE